MNEELKKALIYRFESFVESAIENGDIELYSNEVPYGDTYVNEGDYVDDEDMEMLKTNFIGCLQDEEYRGVLEILDDEDMDKTPENIQLVLEIANDIL